MTDGRPQSPATVKQRYTRAVALLARQQPGWSARRLDSGARMQVRAELGVSRVVGVDASIAEAIRRVVDQRIACATPVPSIRSQIRARTRRAALAAFRAAGYRQAQSTWAGGETRYKVSVGRPAAHGEGQRVWSSNGKWSGNDATLSITVSPLWLRTVHQTGLAVVDGLFTLSAREIDAPDGYRAWDATWVVQGRGFDLRTEFGVIVRAASGETSHGRTLKSALGVLRRRTRAARVVALGDINPADYPDVMVTLADSRRAGNCPSGTADWVAKHFPGRTSAPVAEVLAVDDRNAFASRACVVAVRRHLMRTMGKGACPPERRRG
jgi:hypothetical protein